jgi:hypothetical protein
MESLKCENSSFKMGATSPLIHRLGSNWKLPVSQVTNHNKFFVLFHLFSIQPERIAGGGVEEQPSTFSQFHQTPSPGQFGSTM